MRAFCNDPSEVVDIHQILADRAPASDGSVAATERLSGLEWSVVALARRDGLASLREPGRMSVALGRVFGGGTSRRLADPRLEALRRLAVQAWHRGYALPVSAVKGFLAAGFGAEQLDLVLASIAQARAIVLPRAA